MTELDTEIDHIYSTFKYAIEYFGISANHFIYFRNDRDLTRKRHIGSLGKYPLMIILGIVINKNLLSLDDNINIWFDHLTGVTIRDLIEHTSGIVCTKAFYIWNLSDIAYLDNIDQILKVSNNREYTYNIFNYILLSIIINHVINIKKLYKKFLKKLNIRLQFVGNIPYGICGFCMTLTDVLNILYLLFNQNNIVTDEWREYCQQILFDRDFDSILNVYETDTFIKYTICHKQISIDDNITILCISNDYKKYRTQILKYIKKSIDRYYFLMLNTVD